VKEGGSALKTGSATQLEKKWKKLEEKLEKHARRIVMIILIIIILLLICFSCELNRYEEEMYPLGEPISDEWVYETDSSPEDSFSEDATFTGGEDRRVNLQLSDSYEISDEEPMFYIGYPETNLFDITLSFLDGEKNVLYRTDYIAPGTNAAIDGTAFLEKGSQKIRCLVSAYDRDTGQEISSCTSILLNVLYK
jgi:hypothetical protein